MPVLNVPYEATMIALFSFSVIYSLFNYKEDAPYYCGGIPNFLIEHFNIEKYSSYLYSRCRIDLGNTTNIQRNS